MKAACIVLTILIGIAIMAVCVMVKYATEITVEEKKRELSVPTSGAVYELPKAMGVFALNENSSFVAAMRFPYVAAILRNSSNAWSFACFASVILVKWIITSAHCKQHGSAHRVLLYYDFSKNLSHTYPILLWRLHDKFNISNPSFKYDLAVARIDLQNRQLAFQPSVFDAHSVLEIQASIWKTVFSMDKKQYLTNDMDVYDLRVADLDMCRRSYNIQIDDSLICVDLSSYSDCFIQEFGPLYYLDKVVGVLAVKSEDCDSKLALFTNISYYVQWVMKSTQKTYYGT